MVLNHIDLQVEDVQRAVTFFETYFGFALQTSRNSPAIAVLQGERGFVLVLQRRKDASPYPEGFHIGFYVDSPDAVYAFHGHLQRGAVEVTEVIRNARGTMIYCRHQGIAVEVSCPALR
jgi:catechol 2,3-dioxygenase-like lactoylglutathione lyase family enzyme